MNCFTMTGMREVNKRGVRTIKRYLRTRWAGLPIRVTTINAHMGCNLLIECKSDEGRSYRILVKADRHQTGNFCFELVSSIEDNQTGWAIKNNADFLFYYFVPINRLYIFDMAFIKQWISAFASAYVIDNTVRCQTPIGNKQRYTTSSIIVPISRISGHTYNVDSFYKSFCHSVNVNALTKG